MRQSKIFFGNLVMAAALVVGMSAVGHAEGYGVHNSRTKPGMGDQTRATAVPEIDPASASAALAMLAGGVFVIRGRRKQQ